MILGAYGVDATPKSLNDWLKDQFHDANGNGVYDSGEATYGYTSDGALIWDSVASFSGNVITYKGSSTGLANLDAELCSGRPTILRVPGHFIVATGKTATDYTINDPGYSRTQLADYSNTFQSTRNFGPPGSGSIVFYAPSRARLVVTDPLGRKIGEVNSIIINDIPGGSYDREEITGVQTGLARISQTVLRIADPPQGIYSIEVQADAAGPIKVDVYRFTREERPQTLLTLAFDVSPGVPSRAAVPYSTKPGDLNGDGYVDERDLAIIESALGSASGRPRFNPVADVDFNRSVDIEDYKTVAKNIPGLDRDGDGIQDGVDDCVNSDIRPTIVIASCDTGVPSKLQVNGCTLADETGKCSLDVRNHGDLVSCTARLTDGWVRTQIISGKQKGSIQSCAARSK
jgi:hypothetical protein